MNTERHAWWSSYEVATAGRRTPPVCGCGQDLEVRTGTHCPRCGASLTHAA